MMLTTVEVEITGTSALLMHRYPMEPIEAIEKKSPAQQAEIAAYRMEDGTLYVPAVAMQRSLVDGAKFSKGKGRATMEMPVASCIQVTPEYLSLGVREYTIDARPVVMPTTKGRIVRYRPRIENWAIRFVLQYDDSIIGVDQMRKIVDDAGKRAGVLEFRPARKGPYGRFVVTSWKNGV